MKSSAVSDQQPDWHNFQRVSFNPASDPNLIGGSMEITGRGEPVVLGSGTNTTKKTTTTTSKSNNATLSDVGSPNKGNKNNEGVAFSTENNTKTTTTTFGANKPNAQYAKQNFCKNEPSARRQKDRQEHPLDAASLISKLFFG